MKKTEAYGLNLIGMDDTFSPDPINENTQRLEAALAGAEGRLAQRLTALEAHRLAAGSYAGNAANPQSIPLGFEPAAVLIRNRTNSSPFAGLAVSGSPAMDNSSVVIQIVPGGFTVRGDFNKTGTTYNYLAIL